MGWFSALIAAFVLAIFGCQGAPPRMVQSLEMPGEVTESGAILQSRILTREKTPRGTTVHFELSESADFARPARTGPVEPAAERDFIVKAQVRDLRPGSRYFYRRVWTDGSTTPPRVQRGAAQTFRTLPGAGTRTAIQFVAIACMNLNYFQRSKSYSKEGYPALEAIAKLNPDFVVAAGDNVYYDRPPSAPATSRTAMRAKWHEQFAKPRMIQLLSKTPVYWMMDDHDFRYDDADLTGEKEPSAGLGIDLFVEQLPVSNQMKIGRGNYRTLHAAKDLQIWLLDGRTLRSPNGTEDGPEKSIWGRAQKEWLKRTISESRAAFKIIVTSTPFIGPSGQGHDKHTQLGGFRSERDEFLQWLTEHEAAARHLYFITGDAHWKYHARHPSGFEEFAAGALDRSNAAAAVLPGTPGSSDPEGLIRHDYTDPDRIGGFLAVAVAPVPDSSSTLATFTFRDSSGNILHMVEKIALGEP